MKSSQHNMDLIQEAYDAPQHDPQYLNRFLQINSNQTPRNLEAIYS